MSAPASAIRQTPGYLVLRRVLVGLAHAVPEVGYLQGMNFLSVFALLNFLAGETRCDADVQDDGYSTPLSTPTFEPRPSSVEVSVYLFVRNLLLGPLRNFFTPHLPGLLSTTSELSLFLERHDPDLSRHLRDVVGLDLTMLTPQWFVCLFVASFKIDPTARVWDVLLYVSCWGGANDKGSAATTTTAGSMSVPLLYTSLSLLHANRLPLLLTSSLPRAINTLRSFAARCDDVSSSLWDAAGGSAGLDKFLTDYPDVSREVSNRPARTPSHGSSSSHEPSTAHKRKAVQALSQLDGGGGGGGVQPPSWWRSASFPSSSNAGGGASTPLKSFFALGDSTSSSARESASGACCPPSQKRSRPSSFDEQPPSFLAPGAGDLQPSHGAATGFLDNVGSFFRTIMTPSTAGKRTASGPAAEAYLLGTDHPALGVGARTLFDDKPAAAPATAQGEGNAQAGGKRQETHNTAAGKVVSFKAFVGSSTPVKSVFGRSGGGGGLPLAYDGSGGGSEDSDSDGGDNGGGGRGGGGADLYDRLPDADDESETSSDGPRGLLSPNSRGFEMTPIRKGKAGGRRATPFALQPLPGSVNGKQGFDGRSPFGTSGGKASGGYKAGTPAASPGRTGGFKRERTAGDEENDAEQEAQPLRQAAVGFGEWRSPQGSANAVLSPLAKMR